MRRLLIFTDLDGTLLDASTYSHDAALPALAAVAQQGVPLILCSSKTRSEIDELRLRLENSDPFVSENGGGIFIPTGAFPDDRIRSVAGSREEAGGFTIPLGARYAELREGMERLRGMGWRVRGFGDMTSGEVAALTGLSEEEAVRAKSREYDEPFIVEADRADAAALRDAVERLGLRLTEGRFFHLMGASDKGRAVDVLLCLYRMDRGEWLSAALGDNPNDIEMLSRVDRPIVVQKPGGGWDPRIALPGLTRAEGIGPIGWNRAVLELLAESESGGAEAGGTRRAR